MIEPKCTETKKTVKRFVTETVSLRFVYIYILSQSRPSQVCELIPTPKCKMSPCPVEATFVGGEVIVIVIVIVVGILLFITSLQNIMRNPLNRGSAS